MQRSFFPVLVASVRDTFKTLFTSGTKYFKGLAIESLWDDKTYPVIHLDFSEIQSTSVTEFCRQFKGMLKTAVELLGDEFVANDIEMGTEAFSPEFDT